MKRKLKIISIALSAILAVALVIYIRLAPLREYHHYPPYDGPNNFTYSAPKPDSLKKNVFIMADNDMTELFDLLTPFYLFNETGMANVYIIAQKKFPITTENGPYILPHLTYEETAQMDLHPDIIVIPYMHNPDDPEKTAWLRQQFNENVIVLSICDGAWTAAASGLYDDIPLTSHATGHEKIKEKYPNPEWIQDVTYTEQGNLFSTGGVSNATDGSFAVIRKVFGPIIMKNVMAKVNYPFTELNVNHKSRPLTTSSKSSAFLKMMFRSNRNIGILMQDGVNEMKLGAVFDFYARTMPYSINGVVLKENLITTEHGLQIVIPEIIDPNELDELHVLRPEKFIRSDIKIREDADLVLYDKRHKEYILNICVNRIRNIYSKGFVDFVKLTLDYN